MMVGGWIGDVTSTITSIKLCSPRSVCLRMNGRAAKWRGHSAIYWGGKGWGMHVNG